MLPEKLTCGLAATRCHALAHGRMPAQCGNFLARLDTELLPAAVSGQHRDDPLHDSFMYVDRVGQALNRGQRHAAEILLHLQFRAACPKTGVVRYTHAACVTIRTDLSRQVLWSAADMKDLSAVANERYMQCPA